MDDPAEVDARQNRQEPPSQWSRDADGRDPTKK
jgi:hypothetical protein